MASFSLTARQRLAVETTGSSVIVSAAAGSGKTAVLARRVAYLVGDASPVQLCNVDELLVLTFTDAAAAEMRSRIVEAIRRRAQDRPHDRRLREQLALVDAAQISTIHSFCLWLIRRWFSEIGIDPTATVLDGDEATLLKREVLDDLCSRLYATSSRTDDPLGVSGDEATVNDVGDEGASRAAPRAGQEPPQSHVRHGQREHLDRLGEAFVRLVDDYGLGDDRDVTSFILKLYDFTRSLPEPEEWLDHAEESLSSQPELVVANTAGELATELRRQVEYCDALNTLLEAGDPGGHFHAARIGEYCDQLRAWEAKLCGALRPLPPAASAETVADGCVEEVLATYDTVREEIAAFQFSNKRGPRLSGDADSVVRQARDAASAHLSDVKKRLFSDRLKKRFALFSTAELIAGLRGTAPYVSTIVELVTAFRDEYSARKRRLDVLDFADLERFAFDLLWSKEDHGQPSDIAKTLHRRFAHVLVDEFQDINPIQEAIIRLASRESDPDRADNLFVVGDVKQSIYRFRLAEPAIFTQRLEESRGAINERTCIRLQSNFRSRVEILDAVNMVFTQLMRQGSSGVVYDEEAQLRPGAVIDRNAAHQPVELHMLEKRWAPHAPDDETIERGVADLRDPARWTPIEREAFLIGTRIREWMRSGEVAPKGEALRHRDIAVLMRATRINAERVAAMLTSLAVPAYADVGGSLFGALEIRDVLAALNVLDNFQQDIPLAAVMRSGIMGERLSEDDLVEVRCLDRDIPFHAAVRRYAERGTDDGVRQRLAAIVGRIGRHRDEARRRPLADVLWSLYEQHAYLAYASGLPNGSQRRANLLKLHELARRFGSFRTQGLHRFLRFIQSLEDEEQRIASAPAIGESDDVVRVMSIHQSKGLEFPVVFVAGLGTKFNLGDRSGRMIFERKAKIGLRVVDTERMIEYPSAAHSLVAAEVERSTREEELRILYVAMTRAQDKLVLIGSRAAVESLRDPDGSRTNRCPPSLLTLTAATTPLDWLVPALVAAPPGVVRGLVDAGPNKPLVDVHIHTASEMAQWRVEGGVGAGTDAVLKVVAKCQGLPPDEPSAPGDGEVDEVLARMDYVYPSLASGSIRAVVAASELKGTRDFTSDPDQRPDRGRDADSFRVPAGITGEMRPDAAAHRGVVTHRVFQHLDFGRAVDSAGVASELQRMVSTGILTGEDCLAVDEGSIEWFATTRLAAAIRRAGTAYRREFKYIATEPTTYFDPSVGPAADDDVLVRGIVDGILPRREGLDIVDFKTDAVAGGEIAGRAERYRPQVELYARAMSRIWRRPVLTCWLVFLSARELVAIDDHVSQ